jgi:hypothetical protein
LDSVLVSCVRHPSLISLRMVYTRAWLDGSLHNCGWHWLPSALRSDVVSVDSASGGLSAGSGTTSHLSAQAPHLQHIIVCPRLFTSQWRKLLYKLVDVVIEIPPGTSCWPSSMHEPLILGLTLRFASVAPWILRGHPRVLELVRSMREVWSLVPGTVRTLLCKLCTLPASLEALS